MSWPETMSRNPGGSVLLGIDAVNQPGWCENETKRVIFRTDRGATYTANSFINLCRQLGIRQSIGTGGSCFDAAAEAFFGSPEQEVLSGHEFENARQAQVVVLYRCHGFYNHKHRLNTINVISPSNYENATSPDQ